jgi:hypothetical protein
MARTLQQVLSICTDNASLRSEAQGWGAEDPRNVVPGSLGRSLAWNHRRDGSYAYPTVVHALAAGWKLLAPPADESFVNSEGKKIEQWGWWLVRDVEVTDGH